MGRAREWVAARVITVYHFFLQVLLLGLILLFFLQEVLSSLRRRVWKPKVLPSRSQRLTAWRSFFS